MAGERDPGKTRKYIDDAMDRFSSMTPVVERARFAWAYTRGVRRLGDDPLCRRLKLIVPRIETAPEDLNLADAEHYLYARFLAGSTGDPSTHALVVGYKLWTTVKYARACEKDLPIESTFSGHPPADAMNWGLTGVQDGLLDYRNLHRGRLGMAGGALEANRQLATTQYQSAGAPR